MFTGLSKGWIIGYSQILPKPNYSGALASLALIGWKLVILKI